MADPDLLAVAAVDPVAAALTHLRQHPTVVQAFGGPDHVSGMVEAPWPRLRVLSGPGGDLRGLRWDTAGEVTIEAISDPAGWPGSAELRRLTLLAGAALIALPDVDPPPAGPVVSHVRPTSPAPTLTELTSGAIRYSLTLQVVMHP
ncbi:hypothetical protein ACFQ0M_48055 [Kitasatospora aburaviensis]|uniref:Tail terminator n=1 Tax=Kitasatospora aburaviensis TaxID=67265 RepID=A0ABW1EYP8_9ACTN